MEKVAAKANITLGFIRRTVTTYSSDAKTVAYGILVNHRWNTVLASQTTTQKLLVNKLGHKRILENG